MDINRMLSDLREERERIEQAILVLERLERGGGGGGAGGGGRRRGRPPKWMSSIESVAGAEDETSGKKRRFSPEARKRMAEAQRKRWAAARGEAEQS